MRKLPTGEPCAGELHARFGGRGELKKRLFSTPIVAMDGTYKAYNQLIYSLILINSMRCRLVHPCTLDPGSPCRDDVL